MIKLCFFFDFAGEGCETPDIKNARKVEGKSPPYGDQSFVRYECNEGFKMIGSGYLVCKINRWDQPLPKCIGKINQPFLSLPFLSALFLQ